MIEIFAEILKAFTQMLVVYTGKLRYYAGLYRRSDPNEVFEVERCWLQDETANSILAMIKQYIPVIQAKACT